MIHHLTISLRGWHPAGDSLPAARFLELLAITNPDRQVVGLGQPWQAARIILCDLDFAAFRGETEPSEAFSSALSDSLLASCPLLSSIPSASVQRCLDAGLRTDCFAELWMDNNQFDLGLPAEFLGELARLRLPLSILSNT